MRYSGDLRRHAKINVLENKDMEDVAISQERQNLAVPQPQLEQANQALVAQSGAQGMLRT